MIDWESLPVEPVPVNRLVWPCHDIDPAHLHPLPGLELAAGPLHLQLLVDGSLFVHDGRHRAIRAQLEGRTMIEGRVSR